MFEENVDAVVTICSLSGNTDIVVLSTGLLQETSEWIIFDDSHDENRKANILKDIVIVLEDDIVYAIFRFHAFTRNNFVSSSFRKGKSTCFNLMLKNTRYKMAFAKLGESWDLDKETFNVLQQFVTEPWYWESC